MFVAWLRKLLPEQSTGRWIVSRIYRNPIRAVPTFSRSLLATYKLTGRFYPIRVRVDARQRLNINASRKAKVIMHGNIYVAGWGGVSSVSSISLSQGSVLKVFGDLQLGPGVHISVGKDATLEFGGRKLTTGSGITCNSRIMVESHVAIGFDTIIAWDVYISDSDWHDISWGNKSEPVIIGDHVWIAHGVSILKGSEVPSECVVGAKSLVIKSNFEQSALIAGVPATVSRRNIKWSR